jgi:hypothetical protein
MKSRYVIRENFQNFRYDMARIRYLKIKFKVKYIDAQYINIAKIDNDDKLIFKLLKMCKQVTIKYLKLSTIKK